MSRPSRTPIRYLNCQFKHLSVDYVKATEKSLDAGKTSHISLQNQSAVVLKLIISALISKLCLFKLPYIFYVRR